MKNTVKKGKKRNKVWRKRQIRRRGLMFVIGLFFVCILIWWNGFQKIQSENQMANGPAKGIQKERITEASPGGSQKEGMTEKTSGESQKEEMTEKTSGEFKEEGMTEKNSGASGKKNTADSTDTETESETEEKTQEEKMQEIMEQKETYPEEILELLTKNIETIDFVLDYPQKKNRVYADSIEEDLKGLKPGEIPLLIQWDERWGYGAYGKNVVAVSGCGPTCMAMVIAGLTGNSEVTPYKMAQYSEEQGYVTSEGNTDWAFITNGGQPYGVEGQAISLEEGTVMEKLKKGVPIICSVRPGDFTTTGHFIVLAGYENGKIKVNDPNSKVRSERLWTFEELQPQIKNLWELWVDLVE